MENKIIVALDNNNSAHALRTWKACYDEGITFFKVGLELWNSGDWWNVITELDKNNCEIFLDLKMSDVPKTVHRAVAALPQLSGVRFLSVRGNADTVAAAKAGAQPGLSIVSVPFLSSEKIPGGPLLWRNTLKDAIRPLAKQCKHFVASGDSIGVIQNSFPGTTIIGVGCSTPRQKKEDNRGHKKLMDPRRMIELGADFLVVGSPITGGPGEDNPSNIATRTVEFLKHLR